MPMHYSAAGHAVETVIAESVDVKEFADFVALYVFRANEGRFEDWDSKGSANTETEFISFQEEFRKWRGGLPGVGVRSR
jgi:hypothetical protein